MHHLLNYFGFLAGRKQVYPDIRYDSQCFEFFDNNSLLLQTSWQRDTTKMADLFWCQWITMSWNGRWARRRSLRYQDPSSTLEKCKLLVTFREKQRCSEIFEWGAMMKQCWLLLIISESELTSTEVLEWFMVWRVFPFLLLNQLSRALISSGFLLWYKLYLLETSHYQTATAVPRLLWNEQIKYQKLGFELDQLNCLENFSYFTLINLSLS